MSRKQIYRKKWNDKRSRKLRDKWYGREQRCRKRTHIEFGQVGYYKDRKRYVAEVPYNFSFLDNPEITIKFFNSLIYAIEKKILRQQFYIDAKRTTKVTVEALIYIIAVVYNIKANRTLKYSFEGNLPLDKNAREVFEQSGYLNFFKIKKLVMPESNSYMQIMSGEVVENEKAKQICDFVNEKLGTKIGFTKPLYAILVELMSNTAKHAYNEKKKMIPCWYLYAIFDKDKVKIAFVDTGEGIPNTVKRKFTELFFRQPSDSELIYSAFTEKGRSETKLRNRGHGLPEICRQVLDRQILDFCVISGSGSCKYDENKKALERIDFEESTFGTIFSFSIMKGNK